MVREYYGTLYGQFPVAVVKTDMLSYVQQRNKAEKNIYSEGDFNFLRPRR